MGNFQSIRRAEYGNPGFIVLTLGGGQAKEIYFETFLDALRALSEALGTLPQLENLLKQSLLPFPLADESFRKQNGGGGGVGVKEDFDIPGGLGGWEIKIPGGSIRFANKEEKEFFMENTHAQAIDENELVDSVRRESQEPERREPPDSVGNDNGLNP